jgi:hypothetical protein
MAPRVAVLVDPRPRDELSRGAPCTPGRAPRTAWPRAGRR